MSRRRSPRCPPAPERERALDHLYRGQSNDCYWHGLFGGIYISHMRLATHEHLIAAEDLAETATGTLHHAETRDLDMDGVDEVLLADEGQVVTVDLDGGAGIGAWDIRAVRHALAAVMRRRPEAYHATLLALDESVHEPAGVAAAADGAIGWQHRHPSTTRSAPRRPGSPPVSSTTPTNGDPASSGRCRSRAPPRTGRWPGRPSSVTRSTGRSRSSTWRRADS